MNVNRIILRHLKMPLLHAFTTSFASIRDKEFILIEVVDEDGVSGWSESVAFTEPYYNEETLKTNWHMLEDFLIPLLQKSTISHPNEITNRFEKIRGNNMAKSAIEGAYWDLYAKKQGITLSKAIGGTRKQIEVGVSIGIKDSVEQLLETIELHTSKGYKRMKVKIKPGWDIKIVAKIRERFPHIQLMVDANSAYTLKDSEHLKQLDPFSLTMIEQPLAHNDIMDHSLLQSQLNTPICLDESIHSSEDARKAIELKSCQIINIKIGRVGGISEAIKLHDLCQTQDIPVWCGGMLESGIGRAHNIAIASLSNFTLPGDTAASANYWLEDIIDPEVIVTDGCIAIPDQPGIGFTPNLRKIGERTLYLRTYKNAR